MRVLGIDPGLTGGLALSEDGVLISVDDMPVFIYERNGRNRREVDGHQLYSIIASYGLTGADHVFIEQSWARQGNSASTAFAFGKSFGIVIGVLCALPGPMTFVPPNRWKKILAVPAAKDGARARASQLMPDFARTWKLVKHDGRAEAALISYYGVRAVTGERRAFRDVPPVIENPGVLL